MEDDLREYHSDMLCRIMLEGREAYVYLLFEHKSHPERLISLQLSEYMHKIWRLHLKHGKDRELSVIIPMVLYHGRRKWPYGTKFSVLFTEFPDRLKPYIPDFEFVLCDLSQYSDEEIRGIVFSRVVMLLFKHIFDPDIARKLPGIFALMREVTESESGLRFLEKVLRYLSNAADGISIDELKIMAEESLSREKGGVVMTIAEVLRKEGFEKGIREGILQGIQQGIQQGALNGIRSGLIEAIELGLSLRFGDEGLKIIPLILHIQDCERLRAIKNAIRTAKDLSELKAVIGN